MPTINDIATIGRLSQMAANVGKMAGICFATMRPRVRVPPGPPFNTLIPRNLNDLWLSELPHGAQPWGRNSDIFIKPPENNCLALIPPLRTEYLEFLCPFLARWTQRHYSNHDFQMVLISEGRICPSKLTNGTIFETAVATIIRSSATDSPRSVSEAGIMSCFLALARRSSRICVRGVCVRPDQMPSV